MIAYYHISSHSMSSTSRRYKVNGYVDRGFVLVLDKFCQDCVNTSIILEVFFNRIHILKAQLSQVSANKEVVYHTLYRLVNIQDITRHAKIEISSSNETLGQSADGNSSIDSPESNLARSRERRTLFNGKNTSLINIFGSFSLAVIYCSSMTFRRMTLRN